MDLRLVVDSLGKSPLFESLAELDVRRSPKVQPYLYFHGRCEEAIEYYKAKLDVEVLMQMRFKDNPEKPNLDKVSPEFDQRIMHACVRIAGAELFMSDGMPPARRTSTACRSL
jgi:uncharacterized glyoxalase superfamily protein PhnB